jgi:sRNA-binding regulator protein Hfq
LEADAADGFSNKAFLSLTFPALGRTIIRGMAFHAGIHHVNGGAEFLFLRCKSYICSDSDLILPPGGQSPMIGQATLSSIEIERAAKLGKPSALRNGRKPPAQAPFRFTAYAVEEETAQRQAELFYLQKQIQSQTPMVIVLEDGEHVEGCIEWYDRRALKVRGRSKMLIYKSAIKYMYKLGEVGQ